ncbi:MAG TPA: hypothetical protein VII47_07235 [Actinomycetota bacterium]|jgi:hypothetical protein
MNPSVPSPDAATTPAVTVLRGQKPVSGPLFTCTHCGKAKPAEAYAGWGLRATRLASLCGARSACDACLNKVTQFPADMPLPVMLVEVSRKSDDPVAPDVWELTA